MKNNKSHITYKILRKIRWIFVVSIGIIFANSNLDVIHSKQIYSGPWRKVCVPFMNCHACPSSIMSCPIGILQYFAAQHQFPFFLTGFLGTVGITFGRAVCGWLCPFGWVQDQLYKIKTRKFKIPKIFTRFALVSLVVLTIILPIITEAHWFSRICPWGTLVAGLPWIAWNPIDPVYEMQVLDPELIGWLFILKISILAVFLVLFIITKRPFCRTLCPLGLIYSYFNRISFLRMKVEGNCSDCDSCRDVCPMDIKISDDPNSSQCIRCLKCTVCKNVSIQWGFSSGKERIITEAPKS